MFSGTYYDGSVTVGVEHGALALRLSPTSDALNLTKLDAVAPPPSPPRSSAPGATGVEYHHYRAHPANSSAGCRWLDDGQDDEIVRFTVDAAKGTATALAFMDSSFLRYS